MLSTFDTQELYRQLQALTPFSTPPKDAKGHVVLPYEDRCFLFRALETEKWDEAIKRAKSNPEEAQAWQEKIIKEKSIRRCLLPIHAALNLEAPNEVLLAVINAYPGALQCQDDQGNLPLHLAMMKEVFDLEMVDTFLLLYPNGCAVRNKKGDVPLSLYGKNTSELYKCIESRKWNDAVYRVNSYPSEAKVWVFRREDDSKKLRWVLSPLHAAVIYSAPVDLIDAILGAFPEAACKKDDEGMLPIHLAFRSGASSDVMHSLLVSYPESIRIEDNRGFIPLDHCQTIKGKNKAVLESYAAATMTLERAQIEDSSKTEREDELLRLKSELEIMRSKHLSEFETMRNTHLTELETMKSNHLTELETIKAASDAEIQKLTEEVDKQKKEIDNYRRIEESRRNIDNVMKSRDMDDEGENLDSAFQTDYIVEDIAYGEEMTYEDKNLVTT